MFESKIDDRPTTAIIKHNRVITAGPVIIVEGNEIPFHRDERRLRPLRVDQLRRPYSPRVDAPFRPGIPDLVEVRDRPHARVLPRPGREHFGNVAEPPCMKPDRLGRAPIAPRRRTVARQSSPENQRRQQHQHPAPTPSYVCTTHPLDLMTNEALRTAHGSHKRNAAARHAAHDCTQFDGSSPPAGCRNCTLLRADNMLAFGRTRALYMGTDEATADDSRRAATGAWRRLIHPESREFRTKNGPVRWWLVVAGSVVDTDRGGAAGRLKPPGAGHDIRPCGTAVGARGSSRIPTRRAFPRW